ncbi:MAG: class I SAM-dependent methyltransferase [Candidatus Dormibacteraeota bacterium]|jgi:predicted O-methyltransferase YrrM|nr:class I SAM-dependent methyltransferase [Candidatus Dormibacteraeota bacterium]
MATADQLLPDVTDGKGSKPQPNRITPGDKQPRAHEIPRVTNWSILPTVAGGAARRMARPGPEGRLLLKHLWIEAKRHSAPNLRNVRVDEISGLKEITVTGGVSRYCHLVLGALAKLLACRTIFEIGTYRGEASWLLAHNIPDVHLWTLDLPDLEAADHMTFELTDRDEYFTHWERGARYAGTPEAARITQLFGDSGTFDFSPYKGKMDLVYIDASHSYSYAKSDTEAALQLLSPGGTVVWDDYTYYPGLFAYLNELAATLEPPIVHILDTRLAVYSRKRWLR